MLTRRTLFIVGAGASHEVGLPLGSVLKQQIANYLDQDANGSEAASAIQAALRLRSLNGATGFYKAADLISRNVGNAFSIDNFLDAHREQSIVSDVGKMAIGQAILAGERMSQFRFERSNNRKLARFAYPDRSYFKPLLHILSGGIQAASIDKIPATARFITFNYDRCIENFLYHAFWLYYDLNKADAEAFASKFVIMHPYGSVGPLDWQGSAGGLAYGMAPADDIAWRCGRNIRLFTEQIEDEAFLASIHEQVSWSEQIVFLGFAYHDQNMDLLCPPNIQKRPIIFGTAYGESGPTMRVIENLINSTFGGKDNAPVSQRLDRITCCDFLEAYGRTLCER